MAGVAVLASSFPADRPAQAMVYSAQFGTFDPGKVWHEREGSFKGTWTRRGDTNVFDAVWTDDAGHEVKSEVTLESVVGRTVVLFRKDLGGRYTGTLSDDGRLVIEGTVSWSNAPEVRWTASIVASTPGAGIRAELADGSWLCGDPAADGLDIRSDYGTAHLKWPGIKNIHWKSGDHVQLEMINGDRVTGQVDQDGIDLKTPVGLVRLPVEHMKNLSVLQVTEAMLSAPPPKKESAVKAPPHTAPAEKSVRPKSVRLSVDLADDGRLIGDATIDHIDLKTEYGTLKMQWASILAIGPKVGEKARQIILANGDQLSGDPGLARLDLTTLLGPVTVPLDQVRQAAVLEGGGVSALTFDGKQNYVEVPNDPALDPSDAMTLECWFKTDSDHSTAMIGKRDYQLNADNHPTTDTGYQIFIHAGCLSACWGGTSMPGAPACDGRWHHAALTWDGTSRRLFLDGSLVSEDQPGPWKTSKVPFRIGGIFGQNKPEDFFPGTVSQVRLSKVDRYKGTPFKPQVHFTPDDKTVACWDFSEGSGAALHDQTDHGHDGKLAGDPQPVWNQDVPTAPLPSLPAPPKPAAPAPAIEDPVLFIDTF
jgi:hypothetical protein